MPSRLHLLAPFATLIFGPCAAQAADAQGFVDIERGRYLTVVADCAACHTADKDAPFAGGRAIETPFGSVVSANITPDRRTGIGTWSDDDFLSAMRRGIGQGGIHLYPAMPYTYYTKMSRADVLAIKAYLFTVRPVENDVVSNRLPFPFNIRLAMAGWDALFFHEGEWQPQRDKSAEWNRGSYLVEGPGHCGACHTGKNFLGGDRASERLAGYRQQGWFAPDISSDPVRGIGSWSVDQLVAYLRTGHNDTSAAAGPMAEEVERSSAYFTDADLRAVAVYLKDQPATNRDRGQAIAAGDKSMQAGAAIYADVCAACHTQNGAGIPNLFPALAHAPSVRADDPQALIRVVLEGVRSAATPGAPTGPGMPPFAWQLNDRQVADVLTYVRNSWGNAASRVSEDQVKDVQRRLASTSD